MQLDGGLELICHERRVGLLDELSLRHLGVRGFSLDSEAKSRV